MELYAKLFDFKLSNFVRDTSVNLYPLAIFQTDFKSTQSSTTKWNLDEDAHKEKLNQNTYQLQAVCSLIPNEVHISINRRLLCNYIFTI